jgi:hypothetical protein
MMEVLITNSNRKNKMGILKLSENVILSEKWIEKLQK